MVTFVLLGKGLVHWLEDWKCSIKATGGLCVEALQTLEVSSTSIFFQLMWHASRWVWALLLTSSVFRRHLNTGKQAWK